MSLVFFFKQLHNRSGWLLIQVRLCASHLEVETAVALSKGKDVGWKLLCKGVLMFCGVAGARQCPAAARPF